MSELLTTEELEKLTGAKQSVKQAFILRSHGIFFIERLDGTITTTWYHVNHPVSRTNSVFDESPNFEAIRG